MANLETNKTVALNILSQNTSFTYERDLLKEEFSDLDFWVHINDNFINAVSYLSKKLWTIEGKDPHYKPMLNRTKFR